MITRVEPMKASKGTWEPLIGNPRYVMEEKFDGARYLLYLWPDGKVEILSRRLLDKAPQLPQMVDDARLITEALPKAKKGLILDGEVVAGSHASTISLVNSLASRGVSGRVPYHFMVFDILAWGGAWTTHLTFERRRALLESLIERTLIVSPFLVTKLTPQEPVNREMLAHIWERGGEGVIVKDLKAGYLPGKRPPRVWIKVKEKNYADGIIIGYNEGEGKFSDTIGSLQIGQYKAGKLAHVTSISGLTDALRYGIGSDRDRYLGRVVEFSYQVRTDTYSAGGSYRHPNFSRFRDDKPEKDCIWEEEPG